MPRNSHPGTPSVVTRRKIAAVKRSTVIMTVQRIFLANLCDFDFMASFSSVTLILVFVKREERSNQYSRAIRIQANSCPVNFYHSLSFFIRSACSCYVLFSNPILSVHSIGESKLQKFSAIWTTIGRARQSEIRTSSLAERSSKTAFLNALTNDASKMARLVS